MNFPTARFHSIHRNEQLYWLAIASALLTLPTKSTHA
jgi:hypothetical protein